jgi:hypothetical protein
VRADPVAEELQAASELRLHRLFADAEPFGDLGVAQLIDQPQFADRGSLVRQLGECALHGSDEVSGLEIGLDRRVGSVLRALTDTPAARHRGPLQAVAR